MTNSIVLVRRARLSPLLLIYTVVVCCLATGLSAIRLNPDDPNAFIVRGVANFLRVNLAGAMADFERGSELNPAFAYDALWLHLARKRLVQDDTKSLAELSAKADPSQWPTPILKFYAGQLTAAQIMASVPGSEAGEHKGQVCEANFFAGEDELLDQRLAGAKALFQTALDVCPKTNIHYDAAAAELRRLNAIAAPTKGSESAK
jgi:lipoprotein NlpI